MVRWSHTIKQRMLTNRSVRFYSWFLPSEKQKTRKSNISAGLKYMDVSIIWQLRLCLLFVLICVLVCVCKNFKVGYQYLCFFTLYKWASVCAVLFHFIWLAGFPLRVWQEKFMNISRNCTHASQTPWQIRFRMFKWEKNTVNGNWRYNFWRVPIKYNNK